MESFSHIPVMLGEVIEGLAVKPEGIYFDGTLGGGGHSLEILKRLKTGRLIAVDKDADALCFAGERLKAYKDNLILVHDDFKNAQTILKDVGIGELDGVLLDLGVSSYQIDSAERGFSYMQDAPLDMRMNCDQYLTAFNVVNEYTVAELTRVLAGYGEEKLARRIAERIVAEREKQSIRTTKQLADLVEKCYPAATRWKFGHPAKRTFQAIRIEVNEELTGLKETLLFLARSLKKGGRMAVISFHSLEDRIVKTAFKELETACTCPPNIPICVCGGKKEVEILTRKPLTASEDELTVNKRAESAKLRIIEKL